MTADESDMCLDVYVWMISILILIHHQRMVFIFASLIISIHMLTLFSTHTSHYLLIQFHFSLFTLVSYTVATHVRSYALLLVSLSCYASHFCFLFRGVFVIFIGPELRWLKDIWRTNVSKTWDICWDACQECSMRMNVSNGVWDWKEQNVEASSKTYVNHPSTHHQQHH